MNVGKCCLLGFLLVIVIGVYIYKCMHRIPANSVVVMQLAFVMIVRESVKSLLQFVVLC